MLSTYLARPQLITRNEQRPFSRLRCTQLHAQRGMFVVDPLPAYEGNDPYVFVSYSHDDRDDIHGEIRWLQDEGFNVWYDAGISGGTEWSEAIARAIRGASRFIYFITPRSVNSENCRRELKLLRNRSRSWPCIWRRPRFPMVFGSTSITAGRCFDTTILAIEATLQLHS